MTKQKRTDEERLEVSQRICDHYAQGKYTLESCCLNESVPYRTFRRWVKNMAGVAAAYKKAQEEAQAIKHENLRELALTSLEVRLQGQYIEEETVTYEADRRSGKPKPKTRKVVKKYIPPSDTLIQVVLYNRDPANWRNAKYHHHAGAAGGPIEIAGHHFVFPDDEKESE